LLADKTKAELQTEVETLTKERDDARGEAAKLAKENAALQTRLAGLSASPSPSLPVSKSSEPLPEGITEAMVAAKIAESAGQFRRADAIRILQRHAERHS
jgi:hypothetical protein